MTPVDVTVLLSGGLDSAACVAFFLSEFHRVRALHIDYGQPAAAQELSAARAIAEHFCVDFTVLKFGGCALKTPGCIRGRNALLLLVALMEAQTRSGIVGIGIHKGSPYYDCSNNFLSTIQRLFDNYTDGSFLVSAPFIEWEKAAIWAFCQAKSVPVSLSYSCEKGTDPPCGNCLSCQDMEALRGR